MAEVPVVLRPRSPAPRTFDKEFESDDPYELVGVRYPVPAGVDADRELARCFVEEFAVMGWPRHRVRALFDSPRFEGAHDVLRRRGPELIDAVTAEVFGGGQADVPGGR
jgi:hypothetical protein